MVSLCLYFQMHQPYRLRRYSIFETGDQFWDTELNEKILDRVVERCYSPSFKIIQNLVHDSDGAFRCAFSVSGVLLEQLKNRHPEVIGQIRALVQTGCVELMAETYYHSVASSFSLHEFDAQVDLHQKLLEELFDYRPRVFRNTELIYDNEMAAHIAGKQRYHGILCEGVERHLGDREPNELFYAKDLPEMKLLLRHYSLSDDIAFRFSARSWSQWPLTAEKFTQWIADSSDEGPIRNIFMDFETFGEHQHPETGILKFLEAIPAKAFERGLGFACPSDLIEKYEATQLYDVEEPISWADTERDLSAWLGNAMQRSAAAELFNMESAVKFQNDPALLEDWRRLTTSDHYYYMCTKYFEDAKVHDYFSPYQSPYDSYINFMNVLDCLTSRVGEVTH